MTSSTAAPANKSWPLPTDALAAEADSFSSEADAMPVELGARAPLAALAMLRDCSRILGAFAWGKAGRISNKKSAELCQLMDGWN